MKKNNSLPENRNDKDYFDTTATNDLLVIQEENSKKSKITNFIEDLDEFDDVRAQQCFQKILP